MYTLTIYIGDSERAVWVSHSKITPNRESIIRQMRAHEVGHPSWSMDMPHYILQECPFPPVNSTRHICNNGESVARVVLKKD